MLRPFVKVPAEEGAKAAEDAAAIECMKKVLVFFLFSFSLARAQDTTFVKRNIRSAQFDLLFSYYQQDGDHSAVTGGQGTEKLDVFINKLGVNFTLDSTNTLLLEGGIDVISSASTDRIDMNLSSASAVDNRLWVSAGYEYTSGNRRNKIGGMPSFSIESDYLSLGLLAWWASESADKSWRYSVSGQLYADDLRWGRLNIDYGYPVTLVYPKELRDSAWFDIYKRFSYNLTFDIQHDINKRMSIGFFPGFTLQTGLLSTPFHRFYFEGEDKAVVENLPTQRVKIPIGVQLNSFVGARTIVQLYYRYYWDNFGINAHTFSIETPVKIVPQLVVTPFVRFYTQGKADYFYPYQTAPNTVPFFTSDYDLSDFSSFKYGAGLKFIGIKGGSLKQFGLRYAHYSRSDGLYFNQLTSYLSVPTK